MSDRAWVHAMRHGMEGGHPYMSETNGSPDGGRGEEPYLTPVQQNKIASMALTRRFNITDEDRAEMVEIAKKHARDENPRISKAGLANLVKMEAMNQADEHKLLPSKHEVSHTLNEAEVQSTAERYGLTAPRIAERLNGHSGNGHSHNGNGHHV